MSGQIVELGPDALIWPFSGKPYLLVGRGRYKHQVAVDPFPCYPHNKALVGHTLEHVRSAFPVGFDPLLHILHFEDEGRTNGWTQHDLDYDAPEDEKGRRLLLPSIALAGKRVPPHPAVTRYLVAHEYGHVVQHWLTYRRGLKDHDDSLINEYAELRGLTKPSSYGGGSWHVAPVEVFANDFRLLICGVEPEYWPHAGIERPEQLSHLREWWDTAKKEQP